MINTERSLFELLQVVIEGNVCGLGNACKLSEDEWTELFSVSQQQGVSALAFEAIDALYKEGKRLSVPQNIVLEMLRTSMLIQKNYSNQIVNSSALAKLWKESGINTLVFKGLALSRYYPVPSYREFGDFDCYLFGKYDEGNAVAKANGYRVDTGWYKHSQIYCNGVMAENHKYFTQCRKGKKERELNRELVSLLGDGSFLQRFENTELLLPPLMFEGLFFVYHAMSHFLLEGLTLRHFCDWACWMKANQSAIHWPEFYERCKYYGYDRFVDAMNAICVDYLGLVVTNTNIVIDRRYSEKVLDNTLHEDSKIYNKGGGKWHSRFGVVRNAFKYSWKYREIAQYSMWEYLWSYVRGLLKKEEEKSDF